MKPQIAEFELDPGRYELRRTGRTLKLEKIPMELLILLVARNGHLVTRQEIVQRLWGSDVFVDTEHGINTAICKIRQALRDDSEQSRFIQTVTGKGYRFIEPVAEVHEPPGNGTGFAEAVFPSGGPPTGLEGRATDRAGQASPPELRKGKVLQTAALGIAVTGLVLVLAGINVRGWRDRFLMRAANPRIQALAVLPLENLSGDPTQDYFADGMTDELITMLAKNTTLRVPSRTSVMQYQRVHRPLPEIARELRVDGIVEGSVVRSATRVHVTIQLIHAPSDTHLWAESYDRDLGSAVSLPRELAQTIAKRVKNGFSPVGAPRYISADAHNAYLRGRYYWFSSLYA